MSEHRDEEKSVDNPEAALEIKRTRLRAAYAAPSIVDDGPASKLTKGSGGPVDEIGGRYKDVTVTDVLD
jgi:hypothetical protein